MRNNYFGNNRKGHDVIFIFNSKNMARNEIEWFELSFTFQNQIF